MTNLGLKYLQGSGVAADERSALEWLQRAAELGHSGAQANLGLMYWHGRGVQADRVEGLMWITIAAARGSEEAARWQPALKRDAPDQDVSRALRLAQAWIERHPELPEGTFRSAP